MTSWSELSVRKHGLQPFGYPTPYAVHLAESTNSRLEKTNHPVIVGVGFFYNEIKISLKFLHRKIVKFW